MSGSGRPPPPPDRLHALYRGVPLPHEVTLPVLGVPVRFRSNSQDVLGVVEHAFGSWRALWRHPEVVAADGPTVTLVLHEGDEGPHQLPRIRYRMPDADRIIALTPGSVAVADLGRGDAVAYVTAALIEGGLALRYGMIEGFTLVLVEGKDRQPVHAAMIAQDGVGLLLAAPPGTGKSTVAYAAASRLGWCLLTDDAAYVQLDPFRVWGIPSRVFLPTDARTRFPELATATETVLANGDTKIAVDVQPPVAPFSVPMTERVGVCLLTRERGGVAASRVGPEEVHRVLEADLAAELDLLGPRMTRALERLAANGGWRVNLSANPEEALPVFAQILKERSAVAEGRS